MKAGKQKIWIRILILEITKQKMFEKYLFCDRISGSFLYLDI